MNLVWRIIIAVIFFAVVSVFAVVWLFLVASPPTASRPVSPEVFATILTGVLAVGAAMFVGLRQAGIQARQADIQVQALNASLFDRRMAIISAFGDLSAALKWKPEQIQSAQDILLDKSRAAPFLFSEEIKAILDEAWSLSTKLGSCIEAMRDEPHDGNKPWIAFAMDHEPTWELYNTQVERFYSAVSPVMKLHTIH